MDFEGVVDVVSLWRWLVNAELGFWTHSLGLLDEIESLGISLATLVLLSGFELAA